MIERRYHTKLEHRFRRWSRKAYAVFASLGKVISIGRLSVDMAADSLFSRFDPILFPVVCDEKETDFKDEESNIIESEPCLFIPNILHTVPEHQLVDVQGFIIHTQIVRLIQRLLVLTVFCFTNFKINSNEENNITMDIICMSFCFGNASS